MDEKMKAAFDAKYSDDTYRWCRIDAILWVLAYLRSQQEPVAYHHNDYGSLELSRVKRKGWKPLYAHPIPLPADPPNEALMEAFDRYQAAKVAYQGSVLEGWKLVPVEPTHDMCQQCDSPMTAKAYYKAMIAAVPTYHQNS